MAGTSITVMHGMKMMKKSSLHFANLINKKYQELGIAVDKAELEKGKKGFLIVQLFGARNDFTRGAKKAQAGFKCGNKLGEKAELVYPGCGLRETSDKTIVVYNPEAKDLNLRIDGKLIDVEPLKVGDFYRYEFADKYGYGNHRLVIRKEGDFKHKAMVDIQVNVHEDIKLSREDFKIKFEGNVDDKAEFSITLSSDEFTDRDLSEIKLEILRGSRKDLKVVDTYYYQKLANNKFFVKFMVPQSMISQNNSFVRTVVGEAVSDGSVTAISLPKFVKLSDYISASILSGDGSKQAMALVILLALGAMMVLVLQGKGGKK